MCKKKMKKRRIFFLHLKKKRYFCTVKVNQGVGEFECIDIENQIVLLLSNPIYLNKESTVTYVQ